MGEFVISEKFKKRHTDKNYHQKYNRYDLSGKFGRGWTTNTNSEFLFDLEDYDKIKDYCWNEDNQGYITTKFKVDGVEYRYKLHRVIMDVDDAQTEVDHIKHNPKDNRKKKLRIVNSTENKRNRGLGKNNHSGITGVNWYEKYKKWRARIVVNKKNIHLGYFDNIEDAISIRKKAEKKYFKEHSYDSSMRDGVVDVNEY